MPNRKHAIDPVDESGARLRLFMDSETMGDLAAFEPDPDLDSVEGLEAIEPFEPWHPWSEEDFDGSAEWNARDRGAD